MDITVEEMIDKLQYLPGHYRLRFKVYHHEENKETGETETSILYEGIDEVSIEEIPNQGKAVVIS